MLCPREIVFAIFPRLYTCDRCGQSMSYDMEPVLMKYQISEDSEYDQSGRDNESIMGGFSPMGGDACGSMMGGDACGSMLGGNPYGGPIMGGESGKILDALGIAAIVVLAIVIVIMLYRWATGGSSGGGSGNGNGQLQGSRPPIMVGWNGNHGWNRNHNWGGNNHRGQGFWPHAPSDMPHRPGQEIR